MAKDARRKPRSQRGVRNLLCQGETSGQVDLEVPKTDLMSVAKLRWAHDRFLRLLREREAVVASGMIVQPIFPELIKSLTGLDTAQGQDALGAGFSPEHARLFAAPQTCGCEWVEGLITWFGESDSI